MLTAQITGLTAHVGARPLFAIEEARLAPGVRAAVIGPNGVGKTTLIQAIWNAHAHGRDNIAPPSVPDGPLVLAGAITVRRGALVRYVPQEGPVDGPPPASGVRAAWGLPERPLGEMSAGQRTRAALGAALVAAPDLMLLDEPSNHLDTDGLQRLEAALARFGGAVLMVTHDRMLIERAATEVWELDRPWGEAGARLRVYPGGYSAYRRQAAIETGTEQRSYDDWDERRRRLEEAVVRQREWASRAFAAASVRAPHAQRLAAKAAKRGKAYEKRLERLAGEAPAKPWEREAVALPVRGTAAAGGRLLRAEDLAVAPAGGSGVVLRCSGPLEVRPRARVALLGANGAGKTTLLRTLAGERAPAGGRVWRSPAARVSLSGTQQEALGSGSTPLEVLTAAAGGVPQDGRAAAAALRLRGDRALGPIGACSGGERSAIALACALLGEANLLLLDEPTNHLDLWLREAVEAALGEFPGAVVLATHDRWLVEHWADEVWRVEGGVLRAAGVDAVGAGQEARGAGGRAQRAAGVDAAGDERGAGVDAAVLARQMRLAELTGRLADPRLRRRPEERAAIEAQLEELVRGRRGPGGTVVDR